MPDQIKIEKQDYQIEDPACWLMGCCYKQVIANFLIAKWEKYFRKLPILTNHTVFTILVCKKNLDFTCNSLQNANASPD